MKPMEVITLEHTEHLKITYVTEPYMFTLLYKRNLAYAKFRCGVAPINIELFRYGLARITVEERVVVYVVIVMK